MQTKTFNEAIDLSKVESQRTYYFGSKKAVTIEQPMSLIVESSHEHTITDAKGDTHHIVGEWLAFEAKGHFEFNVLETKEAVDGGEWVHLDKPHVFKYFFDNMDEVLSFKSVKQAYIKDSGSHKLVCDDGVIVYVRPLWSTLLKEKS